MSHAIETPRPRGWAVLAAGFGLAGCRDNPLGYMTGAAGPAAWQMQALGWGLLISIAVVVIIAVMIGLAIRSGQRAALVSQDVRRGRDGLRWIYWGVTLTFPVLVFISVWTFIASRSVAEPEREVGLTVTVEGEQWWWGVTYEDEVPANVFRDANNLTILTGVPIKVHLQSDNVIHGFWVPKLGPKMDLIPGRINSMWIQADQPGVYRGQCAEFCGVEHAYMGFTVRALPPDAFEDWIEARRRLPVGVSGDAGADPAQTLFEQRCGVCHAIRGTVAQGAVGPDPIFLAERPLMAAGALKNTPKNLDLWLADTQGVKPDADMPQIALSDEERATLVRYLLEKRPWAWHARG